MNTKILEKIGLTPNESKVYLALIEIGSASASEILQKTGLHRAVVYDLLERLQEKGLVSTAITNKKKYFEASNPSKLKDILNENQRELDNILPRLLELSNFKSKLDIKIYKGKEGIKNVFEDILRKKPKEWLSIGSSGETKKIIPYYLEHFHKERVKEKIPVRGLMIENKSSKNRMTELTNLKYTQIKYLPENFVTPTVINIYGETTTLYSTSEEKIPFIIMIENKNIAKSFKEYFDWVWIQVK